MPPAVTTVTSTVPVPGGLSAVIVVSLTTIKPVAARRAEVDRRGVGEAGAGDRHQSAAGRGPAARADTGYNRRRRSRLGQHDIVAIPANIADRERRIADR